MYIMRAYMCMCLCVRVVVVVVVVVVCTQLLERLFMTSDEDFLECGIMTVQLYKDGEWRTVTVDTRIPWGLPGSQRFNMPLYARCADPNELWVMVLQKAIAKLHGSYVRPRTRLFPWHSGTGGGAAVVVPVGCRCCCHCCCCLCCCRSKCCSGCSFLLL
jgi:hypothetical protein